VSILEQLSRALAVAVGGVGGLIGLVVFGSYGIKWTEDYDPKKECRNALAPVGNYDNSAGEKALFFVSSAYHVTPDQARQDADGRRQFKENPGVPSQYQAPIRSRCIGGSGKLQQLW